MLRNSWLRKITPKHLRGFGEQSHLWLRPLQPSRGVLISSHGELFSYVRRLDKEGPGTQEALLRGYHVAPEFPREWLSGDVIKEQRTRSN